MSNGIGKNPLNDISKVYLEQVAESAVPGKPAERLGAVTGIPKSEQESAAERIRKKTAEKKAALEKKHGMKMDDHPEYPKKKYVDEKLDPVGQEDKDIDNDGDHDKSDKYLLKRRKAIAKALASTKKSVKEQEEKIGGGNLKGMVKKAVKRIDADNDGDVDADDPKEKGMGEFVPSPDGKKKVRTKVTESKSNWRSDLIEIVSDDLNDKPIKEKKINNKITINPKLGEAVEAIGGELLEVTEVDEMDCISEEVFQELISEGWDAEDVYDAIEEAKVTMGHDTEAPKRERKRDRLMKSVRSRLGNLQYKGYHAARNLKRAAEPTVQRVKTSAKRSVRKAALKVADKLKEEELHERGDFWHPDPEKDRKLGGPGANQRAREDRAGASSPKKDYSKTTKPGESYMQFAKRRQAEKAAAAKLRREDLEIDEAVKGQDTESRKAASAERKAGDKRLSPSAGKANADKMERDIKFYDKITKKTKPSVVGMTHEEVEQLDEMPYQVMGSPDGGKEKKIGKPVKSKKYADSRAAELADTHKKTGGKYRSQYVEDVEQIDEKALSKAQQKFMGMVYAVKKGDMAAPSPEVAKAAAGMTKKQAKDFAKTKHKGLPQKKEVKEGATEAPMSPQEIALQKRKTQIDQMIARKRQQSLQKANKPVNEASEDRLRDQRMERGGVDGNTRYPSKPSGGGAKQTGKTWVQKQMEKKGKSALDIVKSEIRAKHGKGAIMGDK